MFRSAQDERSPGSNRQTSVARGPRLVMALVLAALLALPALQAGAVELVFTTTVEPQSQTGIIGIQSIVTATVTLQGNPVPNVQVQFVVTGPHARTVLTTTDDAGKARLAYVGTTAGTDSITAQVGQNVSAPVTINWTTTTASSISVAPTTLNSVTGAANEFTAKVTNAQGAGVAGIPVRFSVSGANSVGVTLAGTTNGAGEVAFSYTGTNGGTDTVSVFADLNQNGSLQAGEPSTSATVNLTAPGGFTQTPAAQTALVGTTASVTVHVTADGSAPLAGALIEYTVEGVGATEGEAETDASGNATISVTGLQAGTSTITTTVIGVPNPAVATIRWVVGPVNLALSAADADVSAAQNVTVTATVTDGGGAPVPGVSVRFNVTGANTLNSTVTTNAEGQATYTYRANRAGNDTVTALADLNGSGGANTGEPSGTVAIAVATGPASLILVPPSQSVQVGNSALVAATLTNPEGSVASVPIRYSVSGANSASGSVSTDSNGNASITYTGSNAGTDTVSAYADLNGNSAQDTGEPSTTATVSWTAGPGTVPLPGLPAAQRTTAKSGCMYFPQTGHNLCAGFQRYWETYGGLAIFGMPLTEEFVENGTTVQYFERQRFEWQPGKWPERWDVLLGLLGNEVTANRKSEAPFRATTAKADASCVYYAQTGHNLCAGFRAYWDRYGGLAIFGFPISEEFQERNPDTGQTYTVQYFERGRYEWHPGEWPERWDVMLGRLGAQVLLMRYGVQP